MLKVISTHVFSRSRLHPGLLDTLAGSGAEGIELFASRSHFDYTEPVALREIGSWFRASRVAPFSIHAPLWSDYDSGRGGEPSVNVVHPDKSRRIHAMDEVKRALETAEQIPFKHLVLHLGDRSDDWDPRTLENALTALEHLQAYARPLGVRLLVENIQNEVTTPAHLLEILHAGHSTTWGCAWMWGMRTLRTACPRRWLSWATGCVRPTCTTTMASGTSTCGWVKARSTLPARWRGWRRRNSSLRVCLRSMPHTGRTRRG